MLSKRKEGGGREGERGLYLNSRCAPRWRGCFIHKPENCDSCLKIELLNPKPERIRLPLLDLSTRYADKVCMCMSRVRVRARRGRRPLRAWRNCCWRDHPDELWWCKHKGMKQKSERERKREKREEREKEE